MMPDINLQYCIAATMLDGRLSFQAAHDYARMQDAAIMGMMKRLSVVEDGSLRRKETSRTARVTVTLRDGRSLSELVTAVPGTAQNPMSTEQVIAKCRDIVTPIMGGDRAGQLIGLVGSLERLSSIRQLCPLLGTTRKS
jgi:2-methylcitrate dehydratase PrpD